jgi:hypothetical protein
LSLTTIHQVRWTKLQRESNLTGLSMLRRTGHGHSGHYAANHKNQTTSNADVPNALVVLCALLLSFGAVAAVLLLFRFLAPRTAKYFAGYIQLRRGTEHEPLSSMDDEDPLHPLDRNEPGWLERLVKVLVFFSADDLNDADLIIPVSEAEKLGTVEV